MARKNTEVEMVYVAKIDHESKLFLGVDAIKKSKLTDQHILVPKECDLAIGGYFWDEKEKTFKPTANFVKANLIKNRRI